MRGIPYYYGQIKCIGNEILLNLTGVDKSEIKISTIGTLLKISIEKEGFEFNGSYEINKCYDTKSLKSSYANGLLKISFEETKEFKQINHKID